MTPRAIFKRMYGSKPNIMTDRVVNYGWIKKNKLAYELSSGSGLLEYSEIYGVTVLKLNDFGQPCETELSTCFPCRQQANEYIASLRDRPIDDL